MNDQASPTMVACLWQPGPDVPDPGTMFGLSSAALDRAPCKSRRRFARAIAQRAVCSFQLLATLALLGCTPPECPAGYVKRGSRCLAIPHARSKLSTSGGGGRARSSKYSVQLNVGVPQPVGAAKSDAFSVVVGPGTQQQQ
jgi:hypothetical protein